MTIDKGVGKLEKQGDSAFIKKLNAGLTLTLDAFKEVDIRPHNGEAFIKMCLEDFNAPHLACNEMLDAEAVEMVRESSSVTSESTSTTMQALYACESIDEIDDLLGTLYAEAPDSSERASDPPPSGRGKAA
ncbi:MAG: hypothetical protein ABIO72_02045 [Patescibacteria group bacterium]